MSKRNVFMLFCYNLLFTKILQINILLGKIIYCYKITALKYFCKIKISL